MDTTQVDTAVNGASNKSEEIINEVSHKPEDVDGDANKTEMNVNGGAMEPIASVEAAPSPRTGNGSNGRPRGPTKSQQMNKLYSLPAPLRTFPLPTFVPHNPISLFQVLYAWLQQTINPPSSHPQPIYVGVFSPELRSVHVTDQRSIRALWQEGFYGKGSLSRSEPSWLDREKRRIGANASKTSEEVTRQRRAERQQAKWERARLEREAIDQKLREERGELSTGNVVPHENIQPVSTGFLPPVGPEQLLCLPNSQVDLESSKDRLSPTPDIGSLVIVDSLDEEVDLNGHGKGLNAIITTEKLSNGHVESIEYSMPPVTEVDLLLRPVHPQVDATADETKASSANGSSEVQPKTLVHKKSVRFSPTIEETTFLPTDPISADLSQSFAPNSSDELPLEIHNKEHLQLTPEESLFLSLLGVLSIRSPTTKLPIPPQDLLSSLRLTSAFPPLSPAAQQQNRPDDPFVVSYVVYHHFRSLGWCVRGGTKFGVDYLLYNRGPVFSHAEFAVLVLPAYSHPYWEEGGGDGLGRMQKLEQKKAWSWLHCVNRVNSQVKKTLVLVYVEVPPPLSVEEEAAMGIAEVLGRYKVREVVLKRWLSNRSRD